RTRTGFIRDASLRGRKDAPRKFSSTLGHETPLKDSHLLPDQSSRRKPRPATGACANPLPME
ncbi:unnamed protein product, partial [Ascophyllum nodosum]